MHEFMTSIESGLTSRSVDLAVMIGACGRSAALSSFEDDVLPFDDAVITQTLQESL
jgi:hypothetical protein